jgi:DNA-directed RNA polymerase specialized sigma24 family protein
MALDGSHAVEGRRAAVDPDEWIRVSYSRILTSCVYAGLSPADADDVAQDIWLWLLRNGTPVVAMSLPWLAAVARNFILRYRRRSYRHEVREGRALELGPEPQAAGEAGQVEVNELFEKTAALLPGVEKKLLALIRNGYSLAESARILKIPRGSRAYHHARVIACARRELRPCVRVEVRRGRRNLD